MVEGMHTTGSIRPDNPDAFPLPSARYLNDKQANPRTSQGVDLPATVPPTRYQQFADPTWSQGGSECTGFALAAAVNYLVRSSEAATNAGDGEPIKGKSADGRAAPSASPRMMYEMAQVYDQEAYDEGSTLLGALLGWRRHGVANEHLWPYDAADEEGEVHGGLTLERINNARRRTLQDFDSVDKSDLETMKEVLNDGEVLYASAVMHEGWFRLFLPGEIVISKNDDHESKGGHAFLIVGYDERGFWIHNSWGSNWGEGGYGVLAYEDWLQNAQDVWAINGIESRGSATAQADSPTTSEQEATAAEMWRHVVVLADDGEISSAGLYGANADAIGTWLYMFEQRTKDWDTRRLLVFADDGALPLPVAVERLAPLCKQLMENEIYPIFLMWDVAWLGDLDDELTSLHAAWSTSAERTLVDTGIAELGAVDLSYLYFEYQVPTTMAVHMWRAIQTRARQTCLVGGGATRFAEKISKKRDEIPFELHVGAHGAGDFLLSHLVHLLPPVSSCELLAPATTMDTLRRSYKPMLDRQRTGYLGITALSDESERADRIGAYNESVLCLASNVLAVETVDSDDRFHWGPRSAAELVGNDEVGEWAVQTLGVDPEPILGMERFLQSDPQVADLKERGRLHVDTATNLGHHAIATSPEVWAVLIARLTKPREREISSDRYERPPFSIWASPEDPLARAQREMRARQQR